MLWTNTTQFISFTLHICDIHKLWSLCLLIMHQSQSRISIFFSTCKDKTELSDHHHCQNECIQIHSHLSLTFKTKIYLMVRLVGSPVPVKIRDSADPCLNFGLVCHYFSNPITNLANLETLKSDRCKS